MKQILLTALLLGVLFTSYMWLSRNSRGNETSLKQRPNVFNELEKRESNNAANTAGVLGDPYMSQTKEINMSEAIRLAEEFVINNGYTNLPPSKDKSKIKLEAIEHSPDIDAVLAARRNSLESRSYGVKARADGSGWIVVFRYKGKEINAKSGRAVTMGSKGENIKMEHQNFILKYVEKRSRR